jgi:hypothetical protein
MNTRLLGSILIIGSLVVMINSFRVNVLDTIGGAALILWSIGGVCGLIGLIRLNALGSNAVARTVGLLPILGFFTLILSDSLRLTGFSTLNDPLNSTLAGIAWVAILAGMLVVGILTIAAKNWKGWRRFVPLLTVVMIPVSFGIGEVIRIQDLDGALVFAIWVLLGYVIASAKPAPTTLIQQAIPR